MLRNRRGRRLGVLFATILLTPCLAMAADLFVPRLQAKSGKPAPEHLAGRTPVEFDRAALSGMTPGESVRLALPNGTDFQVVLDRIDRHPGGDFSWVGHVQYGSRDHTVIVTIGQAGTYATFTLPDGNWGVVPSESGDWLFDADASKLLVDTHGDDARIPTLPSGMLQQKADPVCPAVTAMPTPQRTIDVLFVMAPDFVSVHGGAAGASTRLNDLISQINTYYANSKIAITLRRVAAINASYPASSEQASLSCGGQSPPDACDGAALTNITSGNGVFSHVSLLRSLYGADLVAFMRGPVQMTQFSASTSGIAWVGGFNQSPIANSSGSMYSVNGDAPGFQALLVAHEMGHNMGNYHDPANAGNGPAFGATSYAFGFTQCGSNPSASCPSTSGVNQAGTGGFGTIMSYWRPRIGRFSNPDDFCEGNGSGMVQCGGSLAWPGGGTTVETNEVRTLNCTREGISGMRTAFVPDCANPTQDTDGDGMPNCVEQALGANNGAKDNDIFSSSSTSSLLFALQQYRDFLSREADADGANFWARSIATGANTRAQMIEGHFSSAEFQGVIAPVARLYFAYFRRIPDYGGLQFWINQYKSGASLDSISQAFASSAEFVNTYGPLNNAQFVNLVYNNVLGRAPDATGLTFWTGQLDTSARNRGQVMLEFSESAEYRGLINSQVYVTMMYSGMLRRSPDQGGFDFWVGYLDSGNSGLALINGFLAASEYRGRFLP